MHYDQWLSYETLTILVTIIIDKSCISGIEQGGKVGIKVAKNRSRRNCT